jgi:chromosome partitioning protein
VKMRESHEESRPLVYLAPRHKLTGQYLELLQNLS